MKQFIKSIVLMFAVIVSTQTADAQTFSTMKEGQRNAKLIKMARKLYHTDIFKDYYKQYRDNGKPV